jgi:hypothetical protein
MKAFSIALVCFNLLSGLPAMADSLPVPMDFRKGDTWEYSYSGNGMALGSFPWAEGRLVATLDSVIRRPEELELRVKAEFIPTPDSGFSNRYYRWMRGTCRLRADASECVTDSGFYQMIPPLFEFRTADYASDTISGEGGHPAKISAYSYNGAGFQYETKYFMEKFWLLYYDAGSSSSSAQSNGGKSYRLKSFNGRPVDAAKYFDQMKSLAIHPARKPMDLVKPTGPFFNLLGQRFSHPRPEWGIVFPIGP